MKDFFISSTIIKDSSQCSMPPIVRFYQYDNLSQTKNTSLDLTDLTIPNSTLLAGSFGNQGFDFTVYFPIIQGMGENSNIKWLFKRVLPHTTEPVNTYNQVVSKKDIFDKFYVIEIPDYGAQANSPFFTDFTTHIYIGRRKLWQKHICFIKSYSRRKVYILIDKINNLDNSGNNALEGEEAYIRICFKEKERSKNNILTLVRDEDAFSCTTTSWFNFSSFASEEYNLLSFNDFKFFTGSVETNLVEINPFLIKKCTFQKVENTLDKGCDTNICNQEISPNVLKGDYFREVYTMNNLTTNGPLFEKTHGKIKITVALKDGFKLEGVNTITISFNSMVKEAEYVTKIENINVFDNYFNKTGEKITSNATSGSFEKVPEYSNITRFYVSGPSTKGNIQSEAYAKFPNVSRLNITKPLIIAYKNGLVCSDDANACDYAYIYDSGELENKEFEGKTTTAELTINKSIDSINNFSLNKLTSEIHSSYILFKEVMSYSFLIHKSSGDFMNIAEKIIFTMVSRAFLIPLEVSVISNSLIYCKIPDYFFANDYWNNSARNPSTDKLFLRNLENIVYYSGFDKDNLNKKLVGSTIYRIDNFENETKILTGNNAYINGVQSLYLGNINLINFADRNLINKQE